MNRDSYEKDREYRSQDMYLRTPNGLRMTVLEIGKPYAIGNPISNPYFGAIFGIINRGRVLGSTVC